MKTLFIVNPHSFVDIITNSSSELFVCGKGKSLEFVQEYMSSINAGSYDIRGIKEEERFYIKHKDRFQKVKKEYRSSYYAPNDLYEEAKEIGIVYQDKRDKDVVGYFELSINGYGYMDVMNEDSIVIISSDDNSMEYDSFDQIEYALDAYRYHLG